jgi:hypothetical protein
MRKPPRHDQAPGASKGTRGESSPRGEFLGSDNHRHLRVLAALMVRARSREEIDRIAGASNGPALIQSLRELGLPRRTCLPCERTPCYDRDGLEVHRGVYWLTPAGRRRVRAWMRQREAVRLRREPEPTEAKQATPAVEV